MALKKYKISVYTEYKTALLTRILFVFTRRRIEMESVSAYESSIKGVFKYTFIVNEEHETVRKVVQQIEKQIDVLNAAFTEEFDEKAFLKSVEKNLTLDGIK